MTYDLIVDAQELYDEANRELADDLKFGWHDDMIHEYVVERLAGTPSRTARYRAAQRAQPRRFRPRTTVGLRHEIFYDGDEPPDWAMTPDDHALNVMSAVSRAIEDLDSGMRTAICLRYGIGSPPMGPSDVAREMGVSLSKVERLLRGAKAEIAKRLE